MRRSPCVCKGTKSNRDAVGARVTIETDVGRVTRIVTAGSGFLSQHSKELVLGLGKSQRIVKATIAWPSGTVQTLANLPLNQRSWIEEGVDAIRSEPFKKASVPSTAPAKQRRMRSDAKRSDPGTWLYQPFPAPDFTLRGLDGQEYSLSAMAGKPVLVCFFASWAPPSLATIQDLSKQRQALSAAGASVLAVAVDPPADEAKVKTSTQGVAVPVMIAGEEVAGTYNVLHRYLFDRREDLGLPTAFLIDAKGEIVKVYKAPMAACADRPGHPEDRRAGIRATGASGSLPWNVPRKAR